MYKFLFVLAVFITSSIATWMDVSKLPDAREHKYPKALNIVEARQSIGYPLSAAKNPNLIIRAKTPIVIIDSGFVGLSEYLKKNPDKKKNVVGWINFYKKDKKAKSSHGFNVYKSALADSPKAKYYLFQVDLSDKSSFHRALKYMRDLKLNMANYSAGSFSFKGDDISYSPKLHKFLKKYQITLFQSIGNEKRSAHYFEYRDANKNKILEFVKSKDKKIRTHEFNRIGFYKNRTGIIYLRWHSKDNQDIKGKVKLELVNSKNKKLPIKVKEIKNGLMLYYAAKKDGTLFFKVIDKGIQNPKNKKFALFARNVSPKSMSANGFGMSTGYGLKESPFIITVGSYGKGEDGKLVPSAFSSITKTVDGKILPHIMGPGQLKMGENNIQGTSFSSPFISAFYAKFNGYNIKNIVESTSNKNLLSKNLLPIEESRWGIPNVLHVDKSTCLFSDKIEDYKVKIQNGKIVLDFNYSRECMQMLNYKILVKINSRKYPVEGVITKVLGKKYYGAKEKTSHTKNIQKEHTRIELPLEKLQDKFSGALIEPKFFIMTHNTQKPLPLKIKGKFDFTIPLKKEKDPEDLEIFEKAFSFMERGVNEEAVRLIDKGLSMNLFYADNYRDVVKTKTMKVILLLRGKTQYAQAYEIMHKLVESTPKDYRHMNMLLKYKAAILYGVGNYKGVLKVSQDMVSRGIYDVDIALLEYFSNKFLKQPKPFMVGDDQVSPLVNKFLTKELKGFLFYNALSKIKHKNPKVYNRMIWNFIDLQESILKRSSRGELIKMGKNITGLRYVDSLYYIIKKAQFGEYLLSKKKSKTKQVKEYKTMKISRFGDIILNGKTKYYQVTFELSSLMSESDIMALVKKSIVHLDLPMKEGFYMYKSDKNVDEKMLSFFKAKGDVKSLNIKELILQ